MKNVFKSFVFAAAITIGISACSGSKKGGTADSSKVDSSVLVKTDSTVKTDTARKDTAKLIADTPKMKIDTVSKTTTKKTVVKKVTLKK